MHSEGELKLNDLWIKGVSLCVGVWGGVQEERTVEQNMVHFILVDLIPAV